MSDLKSHYMYNDKGSMVGTRTDQWNRTGDPEINPQIAKKASPIHHIVLTKLGIHIQKMK